jgi:hypothetical protein
MNRPWLTTNDWPVRAADGNAHRKSTVCATSSAVVKTPSTVPPSIMADAEFLGLLRDLLVYHASNHFVQAEQLDAERLNRAELRW